MRKKIGFVGVLAVLVMTACTQNIGSEKNENAEIKENVIEDKEKGPSDEVALDDNSDIPRHQFEIADIVLSDEYFATEDKFEKYFELSDENSLDATSIVEWGSETDLQAKIKVNREKAADGIITYVFEENDESLYKVSNTCENIGPNVEAIQFADINADGSDEALITYYTQNSVSYMVLEFYVLGRDNDKWSQWMHYSYEDDAKAQIVSEALSDNSLVDGDIENVALSEEGIVLCVDCGEMTEDGYTPKSYSVIIR